MGLNRALAILNKPKPNQIPRGDQQNCSQTARELDLLVLTQELKEKLFIESTRLDPEVDRARHTRLNPQFIRQLLLVMADVRLEKAAMGLRRDGSPPWSDNIAA